MNELRSPNVINIEDLRKSARRRLPKVVFDYLDGGADGEITLHENCRAFDDLTFRPRFGVAVGKCDLATRVLGQSISFPAILAPVGYCRLMHPGGEVAAASAAGRAGTAYILSTISGYRLEEVKVATTGPAWYQLYILGGREAAEGAIERARLAGYSALVITVDTPVAGMRERDHRNGMKALLSESIVAKLPYVPNIARHPRWLLRFLLDGGVPPLHNVVVPGKGPMPLIDVPTALANATVTWADLRWIRRLWKGPLVVKGILTAEDARHAVGEGAEGIVVSNHGGRQLDSVQASLRALPEVVDAIGNEAEVMMDGGVRRGSDIVKAVCLGARAVLIGRAYAFGLAAGGESGVTRALEILRDDVERTMRLLGCDSIGHLDVRYVRAEPSKRVAGSFQ
jgi:isopentenyl diphosphate isomerase/L-lactate dehydrogenase-like FMN-dependent dehydrogenase